MTCRPNRYTSLTVMPTIKDKFISFFIVFNRSTVVQVSFCCLTKAISPKIYRLCVSVIINTRLLEPFMYLVLKQFDSIHYQCLCMGAFLTSTQSLNGSARTVHGFLSKTGFERHETKVSSKNPAYSCVFEPQKCKTHLKNSRPKFHLCASICRGVGWGVERSRLEAWMKSHKSEVAIT